MNWDTIKGKIWPTIFLVGTSALLSAAIGTIIGIFAAWRRGSGFDHTPEGGECRFGVARRALVVAAERIGHGERLLGVFMT